MSDFQETLVFIDLETTGLPNNRQKNHRITECCLVAVDSNTLIDTPPRCLPRVMNKITLNFCPMKPIPLDVQNMTGLTNENVYYQKHFDVNAVNTICGLLNHLAPPVYLMAHNGHGFDFPFLKAEIEANGCQLPDQILCVDTLQMYKSLDGIAIAPNDKSVQVTPRMLPRQLSMELPIAAFPCNANQCESYGLSKAVQVSERMTLVDYDISGQASGSGYNAATNEMTPSHSKHGSYQQKIAWNGKRTNVFQGTPDNDPEKIQTAPKFRRTLFPVEEIGDGISSSVSSSATLYPPESQMMSSGQSSSNSQHLSGDISGTPNRDCDVQFSSTPQSITTSQSHSVYVDDSEDIFLEDEMNDAASDVTVDYTENEPSASQLEVEADGLWDDDPDVSDADLLHHVENVWESQEMVSDAELLAIDESVFCEVNSSQQHDNSDVESNISQSLLRENLPRRSGQGHIHNNINDMSSTPCIDERVIYARPRPPIENQQDGSGDSRQKPKLKYGLSDLYLREIGQELENGHQAENDCFALLRIIQQKKKDIFPWIRHHGRPFSEVEVKFPIRGGDRIPAGVFPYQM